jgi:hypothetical protein
VDKQKAKEIKNNYKKGKIRDKSADSVGIGSPT